MVRSGRRPSVAASSSAWRRIELDAGAEPLVGQGRVGVARADDRPPGVERRSKDLHDELPTRGVEQEGVGQRVGRGGRSGPRKEQLAQTFAQPRPAGLAGQEHVMTESLEVGRETRRLRRLAGPFGTFDRDEPTAARLTGTCHGGSVADGPAPPGPSSADGRPVRIRSVGRHRGRAPLPRRRLIATLLGLAGVARAARPGRSPTRWATSRSTTTRASVSSPTPCASTSSSTRRRSRPSRRARRSTPTATARSPRHRDGRRPGRARAPTSRRPSTCASMASGGAHAGRSRAAVPAGRRWPRDDAPRVRVRRPARVGARRGDRRHVRGYVVRASGSAGGRSWWKRPGRPSPPMTGRPCGPPAPPPD